jgi:hypothetical protein
MVKNALLLVISFAVALGLAELLVRAFVPVREVGQVLSMHDDVVGKRLRSNLVTVRYAPEFTMRLSTNSRGYRGPELQGLPKPILFLGDSFTMGYGVSDGSEFPALVRARLDESPVNGPIEVINAGLGNNGNGQWVRFLRAHLHDIDPSIVVLQVMANDFEDNVQENRFRLTESGDLIENDLREPLARRLERYVSRIPGVAQSHLYAAARESIAFMRQSGLTAHDGSADAAVSTIADERLGYSERLTASLIAEAVRVCHDGGYPVIAVLVGLEGARLNLILETLGDDPVAVIAVPTKQERPDIYFRVDGHWNDRGHELVAALVYAALTTALSDRRVDGNSVAEAVD